MDAIEYLPGAVVHPSDYDCDRCGDRSGTLVPWWPNERFELVCSRCDSDARNGNWAEWTPLETKHG